MISYAPSNADGAGPSTYEVLPIFNPQVHLFFFQLNFEIRLHLHYVGVNLAFGTTIPNVKNKVRESD